MIEVYSDGSSSGKSALPTGYGWVVCKDRKIICSGYGGEEAGTNNTAEMLGAIHGLEAALQAGLYEDGERVILICDSQYALGIASGLMHPSKNLDLSQRLRALAKALCLETRWVPGHRYKRTVPYAKQDRDILLNTRCDQLAQLGRESMTPEKVLRKRRKKKS